MKSKNLLQKKWYVIDSQITKGKCKQGDTIKFETKTIKSSFCDYSDAFNLVTGKITVAADDNTDVPFKTCAPFLHIQQKLMIYLLMKQIIFILQCLCTICLNLAIIIQIHQEVYGSLKEIKLLIKMLI